MQVINALTSVRGDGAAGGSGGQGAGTAQRHVPYRDSKLTRMLQVGGWKGVVMLLLLLLLLLGWYRCSFDVDAARTSRHVPMSPCPLPTHQDSLGGNSRTLMIACVSPADTNLDVRVVCTKPASRPFVSL